MTSKIEIEEKVECYYLCESLADRIVTVTDDYGEYITDLKLCGKCHHILDANYKKFKWRYINVNNVNNIHPPSFDTYYREVNC